MLIYGPTTREAKAGGGQVIDHPEWHSETLFNLSITYPNANTFLTRVPFELSWILPCESRAEGLGLPSSEPQLPLLQESLPMTSADKNWLRVA